MWLRKTKTWIRFIRIFVLPFKYWYTKREWELDTTLVSPKWLLERREGLIKEQRLLERKNDHLGAKLVEGMVAMIDEIHGC